MILDFHAVCGNFPTQGKDWSLDDLAYWADLAGTDVLIVESADALLHLDEGPHQKLLAACRASGGRFLPAATINLNSDIHSLQVARTARSQGFVCAVLHGPLYEESRVLHEVLSVLQDAPLPVYRELPREELDTTYRVAREHEDVRFVLAPDSYTALELTHRLCTLPNVYLSMAHALHAVGQLETACRRMGPDHILYASDLARQHPARPLGAIYDAEISDADRDMVLGGTARGLLAEYGIEVPLRGEPASRPAPPCSIIDTHGHIGVHYVRLDYDWSVEAVLRFLERAGGETIYISSLEAIFGDVLVGNQQVIEAMRAHPDRIRGYMVVNPWMGQACLDSVRQCRKLGFSGLKPYPHSFGHDLSDPVFEPVLELAEQMELPMLCHSGPNDLARVLERHPHLRMLAAHMSFHYAEKARLAREFPQRCPGGFRRRDRRGGHTACRRNRRRGEHGFRFGSQCPQLGLHALPASVLGAAGEDNPGHPARERAAVFRPGIGAHSAPACFDL